MQGYQTLEEAARTLSMSVDDLRLLAQRNQIRSFQDRGTLRFRVQDIQELARQRGQASNPEEPALRGPGTPQPKSPRVSETGSKREKKQEPTDFSIEINEDRLDIGAEIVPATGGKSSGRNLGSKARQEKTDFTLEISDDQVDIGLAPIQGGDSDVKLVAHDSKSGKSSSAARRQAQPSSSAAPPSPAPPVTPPKVKADPGPASPSRAGGSNARKRQPSSGPLSPPSNIKIESDSDIKIVGPGSVEAELGKSATDSETPAFRLPGSDEGLLFTDEVNLEEEIRKKDDLLNLSLAEDSSAALAQEPLIELVDQERSGSPSQSGNYSLEEAARYLSMPVEELRQLAQRSQIRSFMQRGSMRFRAVDIQELAHKRAQAGPASPRQPRSSEMGFLAPASDSGGEVDFSLEVNEDQLDIGEILAPASGARGSSKKISPRPKPPSESDFSLEVNDDQVDLGQGAIGAVPRFDRKDITPPPPGHDSDVRLISDQDFSLGGDSDIKLVSPESSSARRKGAGIPATPPYKPKSALSPAGPRSPGKGKPRNPGAPGTPSSPPAKKSVLSSSQSLIDDSDVKIVGGAAGGIHGPTDSDIRLEAHSGPPDEEAMLLTEEINLDEEIRKQEEVFKKQPGGKVRPKSSLKSSGTMPASPFELSAEGQPSVPISHDSSDFDLAPGGLGDSDDFSLELPEDDGISLGESQSHELQGPTSGINLADPVDAGISLEVDSTGHSGSTPRPTFLRGAAAPVEDDSGSEFELSLDDSSEEMFSSQASAHEDSEFELGASDSSSETPSLDSDSDSASEFELSLDDSSDEMPSHSQPRIDSEFELGTPQDSSSENPSLDPSDSGSEFELSLDDSSGEVPSHVEPRDSSDFEVGAVESSSENPSLETADSGSEFELSLDGTDGSLELVTADDSASDSEFDLTLDDSGSPHSEEGEDEADVDAETGDKDIFETDFEVPDLDEETGSQDDGALDGDTDLESSDFDIEDESGSQVVALDDEYVDEPPPSKKRGKGKQKSAPPAGKGQKQVKGRPAPPTQDAGDLEMDWAGQDQQGAFDDLAVEGDHAEPRPAVVIQEKVKYIRPAPWGVLPSIFMFPCLLLMLVFGLMAFEQVQNPHGYKPDGVVTKMMKDVFKQLGVT